MLGAASFDIHEELFMNICWLIMQVFKSLNLSAYELSVDMLDVHCVSVLWCGVVVVWWWCVVVWCGVVEVW